MTCGVFDAVMPFISALGNSAFIWIVIGIVFLCLKKYKVFGINVLIALILCGLIGNLGLKPLFARVRPYDIYTDVVLLIPRPRDYSFPSGHTMSSFAAAAVMFRYNKRFGGLACLLASAIAFSRLYLYVHFPTDIIGGIVVGTGIGIAAVFLVETVGDKIGRSN